MDPEVSFPTDWTAPRELLRALPRETTMTGRGIFTAIVGVLLLAGAIPVYMLVHGREVDRAARADALRAGGREATAEIVRLWRRGKSRTPTVAYAFTADGARFQGDSSVPAKLWDGLQKAGFLPVRYLAANPAINHPAAWEEPAEPAWLTFALPVVLAGCGLVILIKVKRHADTAAAGLPTAGVVTGCFRVKGGWAVRYRFRTREGAVLKGSDQMARRLETGAAICVLYLPENPRRNQVYPMCLYRVAQ
jgi:hypothetical protein